MSRMFFGGIPTEPDVRRLREALPNVAEGSEFSHDEIAAVLGCAVKTTRYRSITEAWRRALLSSDNLEVASVAGVGFRCLTASERLSHNLNGFTSGIRKQARSLQRVGRINAEALSEIERTKQLHVHRLGMAVMEQATLMMRQIAPPKAAAQAPRLMPVAKT